MLALHEIHYEEGPALKDPPPSIINNFIFGIFLQYTDTTCNYY